MCAMCDGRTATDLMAEIYEDIERVGWAVVAVEDDAGRHAYTYTVGLTRYHGHPELLVSGNDFARAHHVIDEIATLVAGGRRLVEGEFLVPEGVGLLCRTIRVSRPGRLRLARAVYGGRGFAPVSALQVVWVDEHGRWPWEYCEEHAGGHVLYGPPWPSVG